jgi:3-oxoacyl-[acyl-carrier-protein] synthase III
MILNSLTEALKRRQDMESGHIWATDLLNSQIYLGSGRDAMNYDQLKSHDITHILNCTDDVENYYEDDATFTYLKLGIKDFGADAGIHRCFSDAMNFVQLALQQEKSKILIHCANGSNRSVTITIAILMRLHGTSLSFALRSLSLSLFS